MKKILFLIHDLGQGGAEKVLVNLVNNMDPEKFDISVTALFGGGVNEQFLAPHVHYRTVFGKMIPGNSKLMKLLSPRQLHKLCVKDHYDIEVSYLEGPSARIISGCPDAATKLVSWIHGEQHTMDRLAAAFRSESEARSCYNRFHQTVCVSQFVKDDFCGILDFKRPCQVLYNTVESQVILDQALEATPEILGGSSVKLIGVGTLKKVKGFDRMIRIQKKLRETGLNTHLYILGKGPDREALEALAAQLGVTDTVTFLGYQINPYKYVAKCDLFVCASHAEGFSTAATEALIVGTPVCTVEVSGMKEMLGSHNEYGVVTENTDEALYDGLYDLLTNPGKLNHYKAQAALRGKSFRTEETVRAVEDMLMSL